MSARSPAAQTPENTIFATIWHKRAPIFTPKQPMKRKIEGMEIEIQGTDRRIHGMERPAHPVAPLFQRWNAGGAGCPH